MSYRVLKTILAVLIMAASFTASARQNQNKPVDEQPRVKAGGVIRDANREYYKASGVPKVTTEFGLGVGARYNFFDVVPLSADFSPRMSMHWSGGAALQFRLNIGRTFGIQPEISYARSALRIDDKAAHNFNTKAKSNIVQIPMLLSFRAAMFRFNFGPVFTLMDETTYQLANAADESIKTMHLGKLYPTITYAAGISVKFAKVMMLDVRYADQFIDMKGENQYIWTLDTNKQKSAQSFRTRTRSVQLRFGVVF